VTRLLAVLLLAVGSVGCVGRPPDGATGEEIYLQLCSNCHGDDLTGGLGPALGPGSSSAEKPDEYLHMTILDGLGRMPSFRSYLDDEQVQLLLDYLRVEQGK
jgi:mono/diheme cytochrome c family protein